METNPIRMCELLVGLPDVNVLGLEDIPGGPLRVHVELRSSAVGCPECGVVAHVKDRYQVELIDLPAFGRWTRLVWHKRRWRCPDSSCPVGSRGAGLTTRGVTTGAEAGRAGGPRDRWVRARRASTRSPTSSAVIGTP